MTSPGEANTVTTPSLVSSRRLAELARSGFSILRNPGNQLAFEVHHAGDRPGYLHDVLQGKGAKRFTQTLTTAAHGVGLVIGTHMAPAIPVGTGQSTGERILGGRDDLVPGSRVFSGNVEPNIGFVYDSARLFEGLISIADTPTTMRLHHGKAIRDAMRMVAKVAVQTAKAPIISLQSPVQLPVQESLEADKQPGYGDLPAANALAVRFSIALTESSARLRMEMAKEFIDFCSLNKFGFWLADSRPGYRSGNWFNIAKNGERSSDTSSNLDTREVGVSLPVTLVGPARIGSTQALLDYLRDCGDIGVLACSLTAIDDLAFIHLQLTGDAATHIGVEELNRRLEAGWAAAGQPSSPTRLTPPDLLQHVLPNLISAPPEQAASAAFDHLMERASDYETLVGPAQLISPTFAAERKALWVSWEVEGSTTELKVPFVALHDALAKLKLFQFEPNIEYLICRLVRGSVLRGKGKLAIVLDPSMQANLTDLVVKIESAWRTQLPKKSRVRELTVNWREYWLGHWTNPLD